MFQVAGSVPFLVDLDVDSPSNSDIFRSQTIKGNKYLQAKKSARGGTQFSLFEILWLSLI